MGKHFSIQINCADNLKNCAGRLFLLFKPKISHKKLLLGSEQALFVSINIHKPVLLGDMKSLIL